MLDKLLKLAKQLNQTKTAQAGVGALALQNMANLLPATSSTALGASPRGGAPTWDQANQYMSSHATPVTMEQLQADLDPFSGARQWAGSQLGNAASSVYRNAIQPLMPTRGPGYREIPQPSGYNPSESSTWGSRYSAPSASTGQATMPTFNPQAMQNIPMPVQRALARTYQQPVGTYDESAEPLEDLPRGYDRAPSRSSQSGGQGGNQGNDNQGGSRWGRAAKWGLGVPFALQAVSGLLGSGGGEGGMAGMLQNVNQQYQNRRNMLETMNQYYMNPLFKHFGERPEVSEELRNAPRTLMEDPVWGPLAAMERIKIRQENRDATEDMLNDAAERDILSEEEVADRMREYDQGTNALADRFNLRSPDRPRGELNSNDLRQRARARLSRRM